MAQATVFGATGFLGTHIVNGLCQKGYRVRAVSRGKKPALHLKSLGQVGQVSLETGSIAHLDNCRFLCHGSDLIINTVGILYEKGLQNFENIHIQGPQNLAQCAQELNAQRLIHISAIGACPHSPSSYDQSKYKGEEYVRTIFPQSTIIRPSVIFGTYDSFINRLAQISRLTPFIPLMGPCDHLMAPIWIGDVTKGIMESLHPQWARKTLELGGPELISLREIWAKIIKAMGKRKVFLPVPLSIARFLAYFMEKLPSPPLTRDQLVLLQKDNIPQENFLGLKDLSIIPRYLDDYLEESLAHYRERF
jgi:uncharacterized protein YbjT (DUF2867 family)